MTPHCRAGSQQQEEGRIATVDVIVVAYRSAPHIGLCLDSIACSPQVEQVIVVDNASGDGSVEVARKAGARVVIENSRNAGFARAVNQGLYWATADLVLLLNPDAVLDASSLASLCHTMEHFAGAAIVAPLLRDDRGAVQAGAGSVSTASRRVGLCLPLAGRLPAFRPQYRLPTDPRLRSAVVEAGYVFGAAMLLDHRFIALKGGLDERYFLFAEDEDVCRQAHAAGRRVLLDGRALARHVGGASSSDEPAIEAQRLVSTWRLLGKWDGPRAAVAYHHGIMGAFRLRTTGSAWNTAKRASINRTARLFDAAVRTGVDPLVGLEDCAATLAPHPTDAT